MSHTPGPWRVEGCRIMAAGESHVALIDACGGNDCYVTATDDDMRLIAAAPDLLVALKETIAAASAALRVVAEIDLPTRLAPMMGSPESRQQALVDEMKMAGVENGFGVRANAAIAKAEGKS